MVSTPRASIFGPQEFLVRRIHSLLGLVPVGGYMVIHLMTNASILDGPETFQGRVDQINSLGPSTILLIEWVFIFLPILFHGLVGMAIVARGERNVMRYPYSGNIRYTLQRSTGVIALMFILYHVFQMHGWFRWEWWHTHVALPLGGAAFHPKDAAATAAHALQSSVLMLAIYVVGVLSCVYHLANGLWTMGITWGLWTSPRAQRWALYPCAVIGLGLAVVSLGAIIGFRTYHPATSPAAERRTAAVVAPAPTSGVLSATSSSSASLSQ